MGKYKAKLATQKYVEEKIGELAIIVGSPDEAIDEGVYKVIDGAGSYILITQTVGEGISPIRQSKITADGVIYSREFDIFDPPFPEFTQSTVSQNDMALFKIIVDSQFTAIEDELERQRIITSAEGESIALPDSADAQLRGLKVMGKTEQFKTNGYQLFDASRIGSAESSGVKLTNNGDGSFTISGSGSTTAPFQVAYQLTHEETVAMFKARTVYIKGDAITYPPISLQKRWIKDGETNYSATSVAAINGTKSLTITEDDLNDPTMHIRFVFYASSGTTITAGTIKPMVYQDGDGTFEPFTGGKSAPNVEYPQELESAGDDGSVDVNVYGKNLFDKSMVPVIKTGASAAQLDTGVRVTASSTISNSFVRYDLGIQVVPGKVYTLSAKLKESADNFGCARLGVVDENGNEKKAAYVYANTPTRSIIASDDMAGCVLRLTLYSNNGSNGTPVEGDYVDYTNLQLEISDAPTPYEPFKPFQTLTASTSNGLPGIPVSSDGNYTDASGQQWICDEIDYNRGVYVKRVGKIVYDGTEQWGMSKGTNNEIFTRSIPDGKNRGAYRDYLICSHAGIVTTSWDKEANAGKVTSSASTTMQFGYTDKLGTYGSVDAWKSYLAEQYASGTPITVIYELAEPSETPLSEEEIATYKALHTHYPSTSIHNSDNAHMVVDYVADTKNYVDNQIKTQVAELTAAILTQ